MVLMEPSGCRLQERIKDGSILLEQMPQRKSRQSKELKDSSLKGSVGPRERKMKDELDERLCGSTQVCHAV